MKIFEFGYCLLMEVKPAVKLNLLRQSSLAPEREAEKLRDGDNDDAGEEIAPEVRLMYLANERDLDGIKELLDSGIDVNFRDIDNRTALHVAACQGFVDVIGLLIERGADVNTKDRWGSTVSRGLICECFLIMWKDLLFC